jgi:hypothetical protein
MIFDDEELIFESESRGIKPHLEAINKLGNRLHGTIMVDKVVGRAAAMLILYSKAKEAHTFILSIPGRKALEGRIKFVYHQEVEHIKTKEGRIYCPFERMVQKINDPNEAYKAIVKKMSSFKNASS